MGCNYIVEMCPVLKRDAVEIDFIIFYLPKIFPKYQFMYFPFLIKRDYVHSIRNKGETGQVIVLFLLYENVFFFSYQNRTPRSYA